MLASVSFDGAIKIWKLESEGRSFVTIYEKTGKASQNCVDWAQSSIPLLAAVSSEGEITIIRFKETHWDFLSKMVSDRPLLTSICWAPFCSQQNLSFGSNNYYFAYVGCHQKMEISYFDLETDKITSFYTINDCHSSWIRDVSWSSASLFDIQLIATASEDKTCKIWKINLNKKEKTSETLSFNSPVWKVSWNFIGNLLAVGLTSNEGSNNVQIYRENEKNKWEILSQLS